MKKRNFLFLTFLLLLGIGVICCSSEKNGIAGETPKKASKQEATMFRFKTFSYVDRQGTGIEAFRMLIPSDWQFEGGIKWVLDNPGMPATAAFRIKNPTGKEEFEVFPNQPFFWTNNQMLLSTFPIGSRYFGNEVRPPVAPLEAIKNIVIPRFRRGVTNLKIVKEQHIPELAKSLGAGTQSAPGIISASDAAKIRIEYQKDGTLMEEELYGVVETLSFHMQSMMGVVTNTNWVIEYLFSFKAEKGTLDRQSKIFQTIAYSFRLNPKWFNKYNQVVEYLIKNQIKHIQNIGQISRIISQTHNEISDMMMQSYNQRQAVNDKIADNFSQYIRGVDKYYDPIEQKPVELPSGYRNAWTNNLGEYILSDGLDFNPNISSNKNWQRMERKE